MEREEPWRLPEREGVAIDRDVERRIVEIDRARACQGPALLAGAVPR